MGLTRYGRELYPLALEARQLHQRLDRCVARLQSQHRQLRGGVAMGVLLALAPPALEELRRGILDGTVEVLPDLDTLAAQTTARARASCRPHLRAVIRELEESVREKTGALPTYVEDTPVALWSVVDYIDVMVHIMGQETREFYGMDTLWKDAPVVEY